MKPPVVFLSPVIPAFSGNGLAMRAAQNLRALAGQFTVHLLVIAMYGGQEGCPQDDVMQLCAGWKRVQAPVPSRNRRSFRNFLNWNRALSLPNGGHGRHKTKPPWIIF